MRRFLSRLTAVFLALVLLCAPASALTVEQARDILRERYVDVIDEEVLSKSTIQEILDALGDPYTEYLTPEEYADFQASMLDTSLVGIGVSYSTTAPTDDGLLIQEVIAGSPAEAGGLLAEDLILAVDGVDIRGMDPSGITDLVRGEEGTQVTISFRRGETEGEAVLTRATVVVPATTGQLLEGSVGYIDCTTWGEETLGHFRQIIDDLEGQAASWLIDLRGNTGGTTDAATDVAGLFCGPADALYLRLRSDSTPGGYGYYVYSTDVQAATDKPVVILTDGYTASASEAFCAALRDYDRAVIVGGRTYGKGVAQELWDQSRRPDLFPQGDAFKVTMARFYSPIGNTNDTIGVMPDFLVPDAYAADVAWLLCEDFSDRQVDSTFSFPWPRTSGRFTLALDHLEQDPSWAPVYAALLNAIPPDTTLVQDGSTTSREDLAGRCGLELEAGNFTDADASSDPETLGALKTYGLVEGVGDGSFQPQRELTRAEVCQILYNALDCAQPESVQYYADVDPDAWYADAVAAMSSRGLVTGTGDGLFLPEATLDRQQLFTLLGRLAAWLNDNAWEQLQKGSAEDWEVKTLEGYADWAKPYVWLLAYQDDGSRAINLLWEEPEYIDPTAPATRDEAAQLLYNVLYYFDVLP